MRRALIPVLVAAGLLAATALVDGLATASTRLSAESEAFEVAETEARELEQTLLLYVSAVDGLTAFIESQDRDWAAIDATFDSFSSALAASNIAVKSVQIVVGDEIELVHPIQGNERAIGLDLFADPGRRRLLERSIATGETTLEGPFGLVQGGSGLAIRRPIFDDDGSAWGFAAVIVDWDALIRTGRVGQASDGFDAVVWGPDGVPVVGDRPLERPVLRSVRSERLPVPWTVAVAPSAGWPTSSDVSILIWVLGTALSILGGLYVRSLLIRPEELQEERLRVVNELSTVERSHRALFDASPVAIQREDHSRVAARIEELRMAGISDVRGHLLEHTDVLASILSEVVIKDINPAAQELSRRLGLSDASRTLEDRLNNRSAESLLASVMTVVEGRRVAQHTASDVDVDGRPIELVVRWHASGRDSDPDYSNVYVALQDVTELTVARQRLEATLESQNRFIASISHELRTPLTAVLGFSHELQNESMIHGEHDLEEFRGLIEHHAIEMSHIIEDLLVWSRSDIGEVTINFEPFDIGRIVERTLRSLPGSPAYLVEGYPKVDVMADPVRVRQILRNLVTNAFRYGGDEIFVQVIEAADNVRVEVHDSGPEIPAAKARSIFLPYQQLDVGRTTMPSSIGLGLAISRVLAELQDGSLTLERTDRTNAFVLTLRKARRRGHLVPGVDDPRRVLQAS
jgi:signal transduction histidine kinase/sensor domain CHASE-containing protein